MIMTSGRRMHPKRRRNSAIIALLFAALFSVVLLGDCFPSPAIEGCKFVESRLVPGLSRARPRSFSLPDFGGVGDGVTLNTQAFQKAVNHISSFAENGGATLYVPKGRWLTGCFNLTSHMTLFLEEDATILASKDLQDWPVVDPLPSYGRGRELPGKRYTSLIHGLKVTDVAITVLWPRKSSSKHKGRIHTVQQGETLSSIAPGEWEDPDSNFYRLNPHIRHKDAIYPGQRIRLS